MKTEASCRNGLHIPPFLVELILRERNFGHTHTKKHPSTYLKNSSPKLLRPKQKWFCIDEREMKTESSCRNGLHIPLFLVELLLRERNIGHIHTKAP